MEKWKRKRKAKKQKSKKKERHLSGESEEPLGDLPIPVHGPPWILPSLASLWSIDLRAR